jgi:hypothetical protein
MHLDQVCVVAFHQQNLPSRRQLLGASRYRAALLRFAADLLLTTVSPETIAMGAGGV